jgi:hypothetical protein
MRNAMSLCQPSSRVGLANEKLSVGGNVFTENTYKVAATSGSYWLNDTLESFPQWQTDGQDVSGSASPGCTP